MTNLSQIHNHSSAQQLLFFLSDIFTQLDFIYPKLLIMPHILIYFINLIFQHWGELWSWFLAYVTNRSQFVSIHGCNSDLLSVKSGVPQGSILGPLIFIIYVNDIPSVVAHSKMFLFADDTKCLYQGYTVLTTRFDLPVKLKQKNPLVISST